MRLGVALVVIALAVGGVGIGVFSQTPPGPPDPAQVATGLALYNAQKCAQCHQINKVGGKLASALDGVGTRLTPDVMKKWFTNAAEMEAKLPKKPVMPMSTWLKTHKLTDADINAIVAYMRTLK